MFKVNNKNKNNRKILMESHCCFQYQIQSNPVLIIKYYLIWVLQLVCHFWRAGREDRCGVKNKCWENSECLCLQYYVLFMLFWQFMTLHLLQTVPTFMMTVKKIATFVKEIFTVIAPVFLLSYFASFLVQSFKMKEEKNGLSWWKRMSQIVKARAIIIRQGLFNSFSYE